jgi:hypothetical protein
VYENEAKYCRNLHLNELFFYFFIFSVPFGNTRNRTELPDPETELPETELGTDQFQFLGTRIIRGTEPISFGYPNAQGDSEQSR